MRALIAALAAAGVTATCSRSDGPRYGGIDADSNVPDVRITLGGPDENAFTAAALAAAGNGYAKELAARAEAGAARSGCGCPRPGPGRRPTSPVPTCAARPTCRC